MSLSNIVFERNASCKLLSATVYLDKLKSYCYWRYRINQVAFKQSQDCLVVVPKSIFEGQFILPFLERIDEKALNYRQKMSKLNLQSPCLHVFIHKS